VSVFNVKNTEWRNGDYSLLMGQAPALHDTINVKFPSIEKLALKQVSQRWVFNEFNHEQSRLDLLNCPKAVYQIMLMNLAYQWEADSVASRAIAPLLAPFVTNSEFWEALLENTNMEVTHAKTYSEIVRQCVPDPSEVFKMVMESEQTIARADVVNRAFDRLALAGAQYTLGLRKADQSTYNIIFTALCALYFLERLQFMSSFAATFAIVEQGYFQSIGKAVQKIMLDEILCHAALDIEAIKIELKTERGQIAMRECRDEITAMLNAVVTQELSWNPHLFGEGRAIVGLNVPLLNEWVMFNAQVIYDELELESPWGPVTDNPLPWMANWIDIDKFQNAMQEADGNNYALNVVKDDIGDDELDF
jgi:ribonucleoside-diphosphate reductase beta chain